MNKIAKQTVRSGKGTNGKFLRGNRYSKGRKKGSKDKFTTLKQSFLDAFRDDRIGGTEGLTKVFSKNDIRKIEFFKLISKMLPSNINVEGDLNVIYQTSEKFLPKPDNKKK